MPESSAKRSTIVQQLLNKPLPQHEPEVSEAIEVSQDVRARSRDSAMLDFYLKDGTIESFAYTYLTRVRFTPGDIIDLRFGKDEVRISGRNLTRMRDTITEHRKRLVKEGHDGEDGLKTSDEQHVEQITVMEGEEL
jgi:hypothetical protein